MSLIQAMVTGRKIKTTKIEHSLHRPLFVYTFFVHCYFLLNTVKLLHILLYTHC